MNIGKWKVLFDRSRGYLQLINSSMLFYLVTNETGFKWYYLFAIPVLVLLAYWDNKKIIGQEKDYSFSRSKIITDMAKDIKIIKAEVSNEEDNI